MKMDEVMYAIAEKVKNFAVIYLVDITKVPDFNKMLVSSSLQKSALTNPRPLSVFFQVRVVRPLHSHVFLPQQTHHDRSGHG